MTGRQSLPPITMSLNQPVVCAASTRVTVAQAWRSVRGANPGGRLLAKELLEDFLEEDETEDVDDPGLMLLAEELGLQRFGSGLQELKNHPEGKRQGPS